MIPSDHMSWISDSDNSESSGVYLALSYVEFMHVIILGVAKSIKYYGYFMYIDLVGECQALPCLSKGYPPRPIRQAH